MQLACNEELIILSFITIALIIIYVTKEVTFFGFCIKFLEKLLGGFKKTHKRIFTVKIMNLSIDLLLLTKFSGFLSFYL